MGIALGLQAGLPSPLHLSGICPKEELSFSTVWSLYMEVAGRNSRSDHFFAIIFQLVMTFKVKAHPVAGWCAGCSSFTW